MNRRLTSNLHVGQKDSGQEKSIFLPRIFLTPMSGTVSPSAGFSSSSLRLLLALAALLLLSTPDASACAACFGASDSKLAEGMNAGIFALMGVIGSVLFAIAGFFWFIARRAATHPLPLPAESFSPVELSNA